MITVTFSQAYKGTLMSVVNFRTKSESLSYMCCCITREDVVRDM